jgi:hypothetical protein
MSAQLEGQVYPFLSFPKLWMDKEEIWYRGAQIEGYQYTYISMLVGTG